MLRTHPELEPADHAHAAGARRICARAALLPLDDPRGADAAGFLADLRKRFGPRPDDRWVFWHAPTGAVLTAFVDAEGPALGGGPCYPGALPSPQELAQEGLELAERAGGQLSLFTRAMADPLLAQGPPQPWGQGDRAALPPAERHRLRQQDHAFNRRFLELTAPPGFLEAVRCLERSLGGA